MQTDNLKKADATRARILAAAEREFSEKGIAGARVDSIAEAAGVNKRMLYAYFGNKEALYKTVLRGVYSRLAEYERNYYTADASPDLAIRNIVYGSFRFLEADSAFVRILMWENLNNAASLSEAGAADIKNPTIEYIRRQIERGKAFGVFRDDVDEEQIIISLLNFEFSYFSNMHTLSGILKKDLSAPSEISKRAAFVADMLIKYLMK